MVGQKSEKFLNKIDAILWEMEAANAFSVSDEIDDPIQALNDSIHHAVMDPFPAPQRYTTPMYESPSDYKDSPRLLAPAPVLSGDTLEGYAAWWYEKDGNPYIDDYSDWVAPGSWTESIQRLMDQQRKTGNEFLVPHLWQHQRNEQIGGVKHLAEDSRGVVYVSKLAMKIRRAQEAYDLARIGAIGTSYGYDRLEEEKLTHPVTKRQYKKLKKLHAHEISSVSFPANPYATAHAKSQFYVPSNYPTTLSPETKQWLANLERKAAYKSQQDKREREHRHTIRSSFMNEQIASLERQAKWARRG
jgi:HK97 family phage prohead protease